MAGKKNLDAALQKLAGRGIVRADSLSMCAFAAAIEARRKNASVVQYQQIAGLQEIR